MKRIITVQHCQAIHHVNKMVGGVTDWELTELGFEQANNIGIALKEKIGINSDYKIYSSDLIRTRQTADTIAKHLNITPIYRQELREINLGSATEHLLTHTSGFGDYFPSAYNQSYHKTFESTKDFQEIIVGSDLQF